MTAQPLDPQALPGVVDRDDWRTARDALLEREKELTRHGDAVAAERRRLPMVRVGEYTFDSPDGPLSLRDLFGDATQLIIHHFMFEPGWESGCPMCSNIADSTPPTVHLRAYSVQLVRMSEAPAAALSAYSRRMGWEDVLWVSDGDGSFQEDWGWHTDEGQVPGYSCYVRDGDEVFLTYSTTARGVEPFSSEAGLLDATVFGRQEEWEDSPAGWPQTPAFSRTRRHDEY